MKKTFFKALCFLCALATCLSILCACQQESNTPTETTNSGLHTVTFNSNGGTPISSIDVPNDKKITEPTPPTRENYIFHCWEHNGDRWFFEIKKVTSSISLDAVWIPAHDVFEVTPTENPNEILISGFLVQKEMNTINIPEVINGKTVVGFTDEAFESIHDSYAKKITIPKTAKAIGKKAFANITSVHIEFSGEITSLSEASFENCKHLEHIKLGKGITTIPFRCFYGDAELEEIDIPEGTVTISENAFENCTSLESILLPSTVKTIEHAAFKNAESLNEIIYTGSKEDFEKIEIAASNDYLLNAKIYYYSETKPTSNGNFWYYDKNNVPTLWEID